MEEVEARSRRAEETLKALEERNRTLGNSAPLGILTIDLEGRITGINAFRSAWQMALIGGIAAGTAFGIARVI